MRWIVLLLWDLASAFDWHDEHNPKRMDHGKVVADIVVMSLLVVTVIVALRTHAFPPIGLVITLIAGGMGARVFMAFLRSKTVTSAEQIAITVGRPLTRELDHPDDIAQ